MTTVVLGPNGRYYDLGRGEFPPGGRPHRFSRVDNYRAPRNAFVCTQEEADRLTNRKVRVAGGDQEPVNEQAIML